MENYWSVDETLNQVKHLLLEKDAEIVRLREHCDRMASLAIDNARDMLRLREEIHEYDDMIRDAGWYLTDDGGNSYKSADEIISHFLLAKDKARAEQNAALKEGE